MHWMSEKTMSRNLSITLDKLNKTNCNNSIGYLYIILAKPRIVLLFIEKSKRTYLSRGAPFDSSFVFYQ